MIGRDIYNGLIRHIESEIQAGRRHAALDEKLVAEFLALKVDVQTRRPLPLRSRLDAAVQQIGVE